VNIRAHAVGDATAVVEDVATAVEVATTVVVEVPAGCVDVALGIDVFVATTVGEPHDPPGVKISMVASRVVPLSSYPPAR
jgi:hypothetical protein